MSVTLELRVPVHAPAEDVFAGATDWDAQHVWMLGTTVKATKQDGVGVGGEFEAYSGKRPLGFLDTMVITAWDPPRSCHVLHTGRVVRGTGTFDVERVDDQRSVFVWGEVLELPLGALGRAGWPVVKPFFLLGVRVSLKRFARWVEAGRPVTAR